jgi:hypothetical protein
METLLVLIGPPDLERQLHKRFGRANYRGEWFRPTPAIMTFIAENKARCVSGLAVDCLPAYDPWATVFLSEELQQAEEERARAKREAISQARIEAHHKARARKATRAREARVAMAGRV